MWATAFPFMLYACFLSVHVSSCYESMPSFSITCTTFKFSIVLYLPYIFILKQIQLQGHWMY